MNKVTFNRLGVSGLAEFRRNALRSWIYTEWREMIVHSIDWQVVKDEHFAHLLWKRKLLDAVSNGSSEKSSNSNSTGLTKRPHLIVVSNQKTVFEKHSHSVRPLCEFILWQEFKWNLEQMPKQNAAQSRTKTEFKTRSRISIWYGYSVGPISKRSCKTLLFLNRRSVKIRQLKAIRSMDFQSDVQHCPTSVSSAMSSLEEITSKDFQA